jgi:hypothetical protein
MLPMASLLSGSTFVNGPPHQEVVAVQMSGHSSGTTQCAGNVIVGISRTINFSYFLRLNSSSLTAMTPPTTVAYLIDLSTGTVMAESDVTASMPTVATAAFTEVTANFSSASSITLITTRSYWLPFCFTRPSAPVGTRRSTRQSGSSSVGIAGISASDGQAMVGVCAGGPTCTPSIQAGSMATSISSTVTVIVKSESSDLMLIVAGVAVPLAIVITALLTGAVAYWVVRIRGGLAAQTAPLRRRSSMMHGTPLEQAIAHTHANELFSVPESTSRSVHYKHNKQNWQT